MAVDLVFLDEKGQEINLSTGMDLGYTRKGMPSISKFKIKNNGTSLAKDLIITPQTLNEEDEVTKEEYENQLKATEWKTFGFKENGEFVKELKLGNVQPNKYVEGTKETAVSFYNADSCILKEVWSTGITSFDSNTHIFKKMDDNAKGQIAKRMDCKEIGYCKDFEVEFYIDFKCSTQGEQSATLPFIAFPVRINSKGDDKGYLFMLQYHRVNKTYLISIYKNAKGMETNVDRDYGDKIFDTINHKPFNPNKKIGLRVYNNNLNQPTFEVSIDGEKIKLGKAYSSSESGYSMSDTKSDAYKNGGNFYLDISMYDGDLGCNMKEMAIKTEELEQFIYMKTALGQGAENGITYKSSAMVSYIVE